MEYEVRYYFSKKILDDIISLLKTRNELNMMERCYEKTMQFDHPCENMSFYSKKVDGRFRVRVTKSSKSFQCKISWKRRLSTTTSTAINKEEEIELNIKKEEYENLMFLIDNVLKMKLVESYERYRTIFKNNDIEISVDEYPFGIAVEIENKSKHKNPEDVVLSWVNILNLDINKAYRLSWDDKYSELCKEQNIEHFNHVTFGLPMPEISD